MSNWVCEDKEVLKKHLSMIALETINDITDLAQCSGDYKIARIMGVRDLFQKISVYLEAEDGKPA